jgi:hypothetical protein
MLDVAASLEVSAALQATEYLWAVASLGAVVVLEEIARFRAAPLHSVSARLD